MELEIQQTGNPIKLGGEFSELKSLAQDETDTNFENFDQVRRSGEGTECFLAVNLTQHGYEVNNFFSYIEINFVIKRKVFSRHKSQDDVGKSEKDYMLCLHTLIRETNVFPPLMKIKFCLQKILALQTDIEN